LFWLDKIYTRSEEERVAYGKYTQYTYPHDIHVKIILEIGKSDKSRITLYEDKFQKGTQVEGLQRV
jgi:hypothetical protein